MEIPDNLDDLPPVFALGGTIGRRATTECKQGQHDLCKRPPIIHEGMRIEIEEGWCDCRCHE